MIRRLIFSIFLIASAGAAAAQQALPPLPFVTPQPVLPYTPGVDVIDYRPAIKSPDTRIVFERQVTQGNGYTKANLYISNLVNPAPVPFVTNDLGSTTRADWCFVPGRPNYDGPIVFTQGETGPIYIKSPQPGPSGAPLASSTDRIYPTWYPGCGSLALYAIDQLESPASVSGPTLLGTSTKTGTSSRYLTGRSVWAGFSSINPASPFLIAFAGQPFNFTNLPADCSKPGYQQECNYVYLAADSGAGVQVRPLDRDAPVNAFSYLHQGRAPSWSPDGRWIAFESNRACKPQASLDYAIFVQDTLRPTAARQVTDCMWNAQHAKWYHQRHAGKALLIVTVLRYPLGSTTDKQKAAARTISSLDVTAFVSGK